MNIKISLYMAAIYIMVLAACTTSAPTATASSNIDASEAAPTALPTPLPTTLPTTLPTNPPTALPTTSNDSEVVGASTLACSSGGQSAITPELTEGPYFTANSPERATLFEEGMAGTKIVITGYVYTTDCQPVANALLDFWQADGNGVYDNSGFTLRGHQFTDSSGRYQLVTVVPGIYPGRTEHIHVKVQAPNGRSITSQLFFPGVAQNDSDGIYSENLLLTIQGSSDGLQGQFNFVVPTQ
jgi:protocatechuate 3,4-dioxygenase beta subunit